MTCWPLSTERLGVSVIASEGGSSGYGCVRGASARLLVPSRLGAGRSWFPAQHLRDPLDPASRGAFEAYSLSNLRTAGMRSFAASIRR
jgi:hypothetical protein